MRLSSLWIAVLFIAKDVGPARAKDVHGRYVVRTMMARVEKIINRHHTQCYRDWIDNEELLLEKLRADADADAERTYWDEHGPPEPDDAEDR